MPERRKLVINDQFFRQDLGQSLGGEPDRVIELFDELGGRRIAYVIPERIRRELINEALGCYRLELRHGKPDAITTETLLALRNQLRLLGADEELKELPPIE